MTTTNGALHGGKPESCIPLYCLQYTSFLRRADAGVGDNSQCCRLQRTLSRVRGDGQCISGLTALWSAVLLLGDEHKVMRLVDGATFVTVVLETLSQVPLKCSCLMC